VKNHAKHLPKACSLTIQVIFNAFGQINRLV